MSNASDLLRLRPAVPADATVLRYWDSQPHVIASDPHDDWQWETELPRHVAWREQCIAELGDRPIGYLEIIDPAAEDQRYWGDVAPGLRAIDIWIGEPDCLGCGYGTRMMEIALDRCFAEDNVKAVIIDPLTSNERAHRFYRRLGFEPLGTRQFGRDRCLVMMLTRDEWLAAKGQ